VSGLPQPALAAELFTPGAAPEPGQPVRLRASRCQACGRWEFPARDYCPRCDEDAAGHGPHGEVVADQLSSEAVVSGFTAILHAPPGALIQTPYTVVLAAHPEGVSVIGVLLAGFDEVTAGQAVHTVGLQVGDRVGFGYAVG
jgi:uncharacterized OB-fold protein